MYGIGNSYLERVMQDVGRLGLQDAVHYMGPKRLEELAGEIAQCDVGVIPNHRSAFADINTPTRIFEYLALGKPVVAPSTAGIQDYFQPDSLFFFESGNADDLAGQLEQVALHPREAIAVAEKGQQIYMDHRWSEEKHAFVGVVSGLLGGNTV